MKVRCGACRSEFDVPGAGQFSCPACGSVNQVPGAAATQQMPPAPGGPPPGYGGMPQAPPPPRPPDPPSPKLACPDCDFDFIVGQIEVATCPNCGTEIQTGWSPEVAG